MKILAVVPARCGSKGFPNKNIAKIKNKTLLEYAVELGLKSEIIDDVYISTDCSKYEEVAKSSGAQSMGLRPKELAADNTKTIDVILDLINKIGKKYDYLVLLQPTSPIRNVNDIKNMFKLIEKEKADACVSMSKYEEPHPYKLKSLTQDGFVKPFIENTTSEVSRQSLPEVYALNGALYIVKIDIIINEKTFLPLKTIPYIMENNINIDSENDFLFLQSMIENNKVKID